MALQYFVARLLALAPQYLGIDLISAGVEQVDSSILQSPQISVHAKVFFAVVDPLARDHLRGFEPYRRRFYCQRLGLCRAGRQEEAGQPNHEQACC